MSPRRTAPCWPYHTESGCRSAWRHAGCAALDDKVSDGGNEQEADGSGGDLLRRPRTSARFRRRDRRAVELRAARASAERGGRDVEAQGVLRSGVGRPGRGASRLRPLHGEAGAAGPAARGAGSGARRGRGEVGPRGRDGAAGARAGGPLLDSVPAGVGDQPARVRARRRGRGGSGDAARIVPLGGKRSGVRPPTRDAPRLRSRGRHRSWRVPVPRALASGGAGRTEGLGVAARLPCARRSRTGRGGRRRALAPGGALRVGRGARGAFRGREGPALLPLDPGADAVLRRVLRLGAVGARWCGTRRRILVRRR